MSSTGALQRPDAASLQSRWRSLALTRHIDRGQSDPRGFEYSTFRKRPPTSELTLENQFRLARNKVEKRALRDRVHSHVADPLKPTLISLYMSRKGAFSIEEKGGDVDEEEIEEKQKEPQRTESIPWYYKEPSTKFMVVFLIAATGVVLYVNVYM